MIIQERRMVICHGKSAIPAYRKVFYFFACMNLVLIFLIVFVIPLRRWRQA